MRFCRVCMSPLLDGVKGDLCSKKCREQVRQYKKRDYDKQKRRERWDASIQRVCQVCGTKLHRRGSMCKACRRRRYYVPVSEREYRIGPE